jgi:hypothetical protein
MECLGSEEEKVNVDLNRILSQVWIEAKIISYFNCRNSWRYSRC